MTMDREIMRGNYYVRHATVMHYLGLRCLKLFSWRATLSSSAYAESVYGSLDILYGGRLHAKSGERRTHRAEI